MDFNRRCLFLAVFWPSVLEYDLLLYGWRASLLRHPIDSAWSGNILQCKKDIEKEDETGYNEMEGTFS